MTIEDAKQPVRVALYGHTSEESAYLVNDYPYGRTIRCRIRYWLESDPKKGFRFVSQTENPKTLRWNAPKKATYLRFAGNLFLDPQGHVQWTGISEYDDAKKVAEFVRDFPQSDLQLLKVWAMQKAAYYSLRAQGKAYFTINQVKQEPTASDLAQAQTEKVEWEQVLVAFNDLGNAHVAQAVGEVMEKLSPEERADILAQDFHNDCEC